MFLAPITLPRDAEAAPAPSKSLSKNARTHARPVRAKRRDGVMRTGQPIERAAVKRVLLVWLVAGCGVALLLAPSLFSRSAGASVVFWLVGAPLIDLAWLSRAQIFSAFRRAMSVRRPRGQARRWTRGVAR